MRQLMYVDFWMSQPSICNVPMLKLTLIYSVLTFLSTQSRFMHIKSIPAVSRGKPVNNCTYIISLLEAKRGKIPYIYMHLFVSDVFTNLGAWNVYIANTSQEKNLTM